MKTTRAIPMYGVYKDDELIAKGTSQELSEKFYVVQGVIPTCAKYGRKLLREYRVELLPEKKDTENNLDKRIKELSEKGLTQVQIAMRLSIGKSTVSRRMKIIREAEE